MQNTVQPFLFVGFLFEEIQKDRPATACDPHRRVHRRVNFEIIQTEECLGCSFLLFGQDKDQLKKDLVWSMSFLSNLQPLYEVLGYWDQVGPFPFSHPFFQVISYRFLVHCWSLGVEIQFYLIAPLLIFCTNQLSPIPRYATVNSAHILQKRSSAVSRSLLSLFPVSIVSEGGLWPVAQSHLAVSSGISLLREIRQAATSRKGKSTSGKR